MIGIDNIYHCTKISLETWSCVLNSSAFCEFLSTVEFLSDDKLCTIVSVSFVPNVLFPVSFASLSSL